MNCSHAVIQEVIEHLRHLPELKEAIRAVEDKNNIFFGMDPFEYISKWYTEYLFIIKDISTIQKSDINKVRVANIQCKVLGIAHGTAARGGLEDFLETLGSEGQKRLFVAITQGVNPQSSIFTEAVNDLSHRMTEGHRLAKKGGELSDGASKEADYAIWGHTKGLQPAAMVHFVLCHFLERVFTAQFSRYPDTKVRDMVRQKDTLLAAIGDILLLRNAQEKVNKDIIALWTTSREKGGLQWISKDRVNLFKKQIC